MAYDSISDPSNPFTKTGLSREDVALLQYVTDAKAATGHDLVVTGTTVQSKVPGRCVNSPRRGHHLGRGSDMAKDTPRDDVADLRARLVNRLDCSAGPDGCWPFQGYRYPSGYGSLWFRPVQRAILTHRASWIVFRGEIPEDLHVLHSCDNPPCCNPAHLRLGTPADNGSDRAIRRRTANGQKTHCAHGHPFEGENLAFTWNGRRRCLTCERERHQRRRRPST